AIKAERRQEAHLNKLGLDYGRLKREVDTNANLYDLVANRLKEIGLIGMLQVNNVSMLDAARVPVAPYKPDWKTNMLASLFFAVFLSLGLALLLEILDQTFKDQEEVESFLGLPFLGIMPAISPESKLPKNPTKKELMALARKKDLYSETHSKSTLSECARAIRTNLLFMTPDKPFRSLLVSSSLAGEGKTTLAVNLAVTMAQAGSRVILVDADLRRPRIHKSFQVENEIGLSNLIVNSSDMNEAIVHSSIDNLDLLPCGPVPPNPAELLHTSGFKQTLEELYKRYDKIIFDSPPVSAVTDPVVLGTSVDGVLMVIKTGTTHRNAVKRSVRALQDAHARILGVVLNDSEASKTQYGYSYARYYWYGNYYYGGQYGEKSAEG
ncbi:MAG: polysaccharide biosynthesis tyrosine autokinase, partial [Deltaproteobacteria bacterium]|nr:polysaccharide biosynthesis tyrosine autokinase [Deltaproteobacteria bacterium]